MLDLAKATATGQLPLDAYWGTVILKYQGRSGDLVPIATSFDVTGRYGLQTPFSEGLSRLWKGSMWHVDGRRNSLILTGNGGTEPTRATVTLFYNKGKASYPIERRLEPGEQIWADVGEIIRNQIPDKDGKTIPPDTMMGSYELRDLDHPGVGHLYEGKLVIDKTWGHGYYGCATCCGTEETAMNPDPLGGPITTGAWNDFEARDACTDSWEDVTGEATDWTSDNAGVVTIARGYTNFVGVGSTYGSAQVQLESDRHLQECPVMTYGGQNTQNTLAMTCSPSTVAWGGSVSCTVRGASASQVTGWNFSASGLAVNGPTGTLTWTGPMVASGTVTATAAGVTLSTSVTVDARSAFQAVTVPTPQLVPSGTAPMPVLTSPPSGAEGTFGQSAYVYSFTLGPPGAASSGPNAGLYYATSLTDASSYPWELNPGLTNTGDPFYLHQGQNAGYGCYATVSQIVAAVQAHEIGMPGPSHYSEVAAALAGDNPATFATTYVGTSSGIQSGVEAAYNAAVLAGNVEPRTDLPTNIDYPPYPECPQ